MTESIQFIQKFVEKYVRLNKNKLQIQIADCKLNLIFTSGEEKAIENPEIIKYIISSRRPVLLNNPKRDMDSEENIDTSYYQPLFCGENLWGVAIIHGQIDVVELCGDSLKASIEAFLDLENARIGEYSSADQLLLRELISENPNQDFVHAKMKDYITNNDHIYSLILLEFDETKNSYFNIELNLGYSEPLARSRQNILTVIKNNEFLTQKDIAAFLDDHHILILKMFFSVNDTARTYLALDNICRSILNDLQVFYSFTFHICYGNTFTNIFDTYRSYQEALTIYNIGRNLHMTKNFYTLEDIIFEYTCNFLHPQIVNKMILPYIELLSAEFGENLQSFIDVIEGYVDQCMSLTRTASQLFLHRNTVDSKIEKFQKITGLNPGKNYRDSFLAKMLAVYLKLHPGTCG